MTREPFGGAPMSAGAWDEIRTAYHVAREGTVSGAAAALGVHHATVIRHVDALEGRLGVKLFQRHARGYTPTEGGRELLQVAQATDDQFTQLVGRLKGRGDAVTGELVVTSLPAHSRRLTPVLAAFQAEHPGLVVRYLTGDRLLRLEYGEAHVALRAGSRPDNPDNVVQPFVEQSIAIYGSRDYLARRGTPEDEAALAGHDFVGFDDAMSRAPFDRWLRATVPPERIVFRSGDPGVLRDAIEAGVGLGFLLAWNERRGADLVQVIPPRPEWTAPLWLVTHVDLHRTPKVQAFLSFLKEAARGWGD
jgi:DNA-binding transcriptional LysR family regulator